MAMFGKFPIYVNYVLAKGDLICHFGKMTNDQQLFLALHTLIMPLLRAKGIQLCTYVHNMLYVPTRLKPLA